MRVSAPQCDLPEGLLGMARPALDRALQAERRRSVETIRELRQEG